MIRTTPQTLSDYLNEYVVTRSIEENSAEQYRLAVRLFERWLGHPCLLNELDEVTISTWLRDYSRTVAPTTVRNKRTAIVGLWRNAADDGYCSPPMRRIRSARIVLEPRECWTVDEVRKLRETCRTIKRRHACGLPRSVWWELAVCVAWDTGLRWGDLIRLPVTKIPPDGVFAIVQHKTRTLAICRLWPQTMELLRKSLEMMPRDLVCPWSGSGETFRDQVRTLVKKAGIRKGTWKWLRRASATDVEIQERGAAGVFLGHRPGSRVADVFYVSPRIVAAAGRLVSPTPLAIEASDVTQPNSDLPGSGKKAI
jgi:integrase